MIDKDQFLEIIHRANLEPTKKFKAPQTTAQEIGWITTPFVYCHQTTCMQSN
jgi:hypothetical protein